MKLDQLLAISRTIDESLKAVCPIKGMRFAKIEDKSTWKINFQECATDEQKKAAFDVLAAFDPSKILPDPIQISDGQLAAILVAKGLLTNVDLSTNAQDDSVTPIVGTSSATSL